MVMVRVQLTSSSVILWVKLCVIALLVAFVWTVPRAVVIMRCASDCDVMRADRIVFCVLP